MSTLFRSMTRKSGKVVIKYTLNSSELLRLHSEPWSLYIKNLFFFRLS